MADVATQNRKYRLSATELMLMACWIGAIALLVLLVAFAAMRLVQQRAAAGRFQERLADERMLRQAAEVKLAQAAAAKSRLQAAQAEKSAVVQSRQAGPATGMDQTSPRSASGPRDP